MSNLKHIGRQRNGRRRCLVAYRTLPGDPESCLVIYTDSLPADEHDSIMKVVESNTGQSSYELAEALVRSVFPDGRNILHGLHRTGKLVKMKTSDIEMTPDTKNIIALDQLNLIIAEQKGVALEDLAVKDTSGAKKTASNEAQTEAMTAPVTESVQEPLSDEDLARQLRSQADALFKEAQKLRKQAEELVPTKKKTTTKKTIEESA